MRPTNWWELPATVLERLLENIELDYCPYEGSRDETVNMALHNADNLSCHNKQAIASGYACTDDAALLNLVRSCRDALLRQIDGLNRLEQNLVEGGRND